METGAPVRSSERSQSLAGLVAERARERPDAIAVEDGERRLTYAELDRSSAGIAAGLSAAGIEAEEPVGVCLPRSWQAVCAMLGTLRAGGAYVPVNPEYPTERRRRLLELAGVRTIFAESRRNGDLPAGIEPFDAETLALEGPEGELPLPPGDDRLACLLFTSGSTGVPKGVEITHANVAHLLGCGSPVIPESDDAVLGAAPVEFDISMFEIWAALTAGARLVLAPPGRPDPRRIGQLIASRGVSYAMFAAGLFEQVVRAALPELGGMRLVAAGGDVMSPAAAAALRRAHPHVRLFNTYGPTETTVTAACFEVGDVDGSPVPIGRALPGYTLRILDDDGEPTPPGEPGELWIGGPGVARGYRGNPERSAERFRPDPDAPSPGARTYGTGDIVRVGDEGELMFLGRRDDQVKIAGHRVEPGEVEQTLGAHPDVRHAAVIAREDVAGHKRLLGYATLHEGAGAGGAKLIEHLGAQLPAYMLPATVEILDELPLTARGKVDRAALPALSRASSDEVAEGAVGAVAELMAELLELESIGADEDFFALGADSLLAIQLTGCLRERFGAEIDIETVFNAPTPRTLAVEIEASEGADRRPPLRRAEVPGPAPASFAQRRAWLFERMNPGSLAFQYACVLELEGDLDEEALQAALADLIERHEILRTALVEREGEPVQIVQAEVDLPLEEVDLRGADGLAWRRLVRERVRRRIDLAEAPLMRWTLVRRAERLWSLIDVEHHAVHDGWSSMVWLDELAELYSARAERRAPALPEPAVQFTDFARWERRLLTPERKRAQLAHWRRTLDPDPPLLELPSARTRGRRESFAGGSVRRRLDADLAAAVRRLAREQGATAFMASLAAFAVLLGRIGEQEEVQIGSGLANRTDPAAERLIGMCVATVALRLDLSGDPTVRELISRVRQIVLEAIAHADVPFELVVEELAPPRRPGRSPLIQTLFSFDDAPSRGRRWAGLEARLTQPISNGTAKADLNVIGVDHGDGRPFFVWEHSDLISDASADRLAGQHLRLLEQFVERPQARLSELDLATAAERERLEAWRSSPEEYDREATVHGLIERRALQDPGALAVLDGETRLSYEQLLSHARAVAGALQARGVRRGDCVGVLLPRSAGSIAANLGVLLAGAAYLPLDPLHPAVRISRALGDAGVRTVLADAELGRELLADVETIHLSDALRAPPGVPVEVGPQDLAYVICTSGSTGEPKGVEVTHRNVVRLVDDPDFADLGPGRTMLHAASPAFDATTLELWGPLANGGAVAVLGEQPSPDAVAAAIERQGVDTLWLTAGLFHELVGRRPDCLARVEQLLAGGDVLSPDHVRRALGELPEHGRLTNGYGPTETTTFALTHTLRPGDEVDGPVPIGRPIQGTACTVVDGRGRELPVGVPGELWIGGDGVARGYRGDPELTAARFRPDPSDPERRVYRSGDRVRRRADGALEFLGRLDRQVKVRGFRVEPAEIEEALRAHPAVADVVVVPYERAPRDVALAAYVVPAAETAFPGPAALRARAAALLPSAMVPAAWIELPELPLGPTGKVDRARLPAPGREHLAAGAGAGDTAARDERERRVVRAFEEVLGVRPVGAEDDFVALGGHSLLAVALFAELERIAGRRLPLATIFEAPTPRALAAALKDGDPARGWQNLVALKRTGSRPPLFAVSAGDGNIVGFGPLARNLSADQPLYALQPTGMDGKHPIDQGIEAMAKHYLEQVRAVQPHGPYLLAGRCNGATVAYEMAQQLRRDGEDVPLLVSLDSDPPPAGPYELVPGVPYDPMMETAWIGAREAGDEAPDPRRPGGLAALAEWLREPVAPGVSRYLHEVWRHRIDLIERLPDPLGADAEALSGWAWEHGVHEEVSPFPLLPAGARECRLPDGERWDWAMARAWRSLGNEPPDPLSPAGWARLRTGLTEPVEGGPLNRYLLAAWERPDLRAAFPEPLGTDAESLLTWAWLEGVGEGLHPGLLPRLPHRLPPAHRARLALRPLGAAGQRTSRQVGREARKLGVEARARAIEGVERLLDRPLPGARWRIERRVVAAARRARADYRAEPWPGQILLVTSTEFADKWTYPAWPLRAEGDLVRRQLPLGHVEMLREPGAALLARCLEEGIAEALER